MVTTKPRHTKYVSSPSPVNETKAAVTATKGVVVYSVTANNGATCILLKTDGLIEVKCNYYSFDGPMNTEIYLKSEIISYANRRLIFICAGK